MRILLLGATGQVGFELRPLLARQGELVATARDGSADRLLDAGDFDALDRTLDAMRPDLIVNAAAYTAVDRAEREPAMAHRLNADVPARIGRWAADRDAAVVHYSTDYVFDGARRTPYRETDTPNPLGVYGATKLAGDVALQDSGCRAVILRVGWIYGPRGTNFFRTALGLLRTEREIRMVDDQTGTPTWSRAIAEATGAVVARLATAEGAGFPGGTYHLAPSGEASWYEFARAIQAEFPTTCRIVPTPGRLYPREAPRPEYSVLNGDKLSNTFGIALPHWREQLAQYCRALRCEPAATSNLSTHPR